MQKFHVYQFITALSRSISLRSAQDLLRKQSVFTKASIGIVSTTAMIGAPVLALASYQDQTIPPAQAPVSAWQQPPTISSSAESVTLPQVPNSSQSQNFSNQNTGSDSEKSQQSNNNSSSTHVIVNGETVVNDTTGSVHKTILNSDGSTRVDVNVESNSQAGVSSNTSTTVQTQSTSSGTTTINSSTFRTGGSN
jgi:hypothetical protein